MPWPNTTKEEIEEFDRKLQENVAKYYRDRLWRALANALLEEKTEKR